jgi:hypothetical protein
VVAVVARLVALAAPEAQAVVEPVAALMLAPAWLEQPTRVAAAAVALTTAMAQQAAPAS